MATKWTLSSKIILLNAVLLLTIQQAPDLGIGWMVPYLTYAMGLGTIALRLFGTPTKLTWRRKPKTPKQVDTA
jgi:hypothetical protein